MDMLKAFGFAWCGLTILFIIALARVAGGFIKQENDGK